MTRAAVRVDHLSKRYRIGEKQQHRAIRDALAASMNTMRAAMDQRYREQRDNARSVWALNNVSFAVEQGDVLGIIGRNGAGKSTLLRIIAGITEPTGGYVDIRGRVGSLLEVGTGFHPELSGRENVYLNGAILGMRRGEIARKFDEIVGFAEVAKFIDTPVKRYSSGMYMRLAFSVAAHLETEVLLVDEVLSVGDAQFQRKCLGKIDAVARAGRTVLFVSHNMAAIRRLCTQGILLDNGMLVSAGPISAVADLYNSRDESAEPARFDARNRTGLGWARITDVRLINQARQRIASIACDADLEIEIDVCTRDSATMASSLRGLVLELVFHSEQGLPILSLMNVDHGGEGLPEKRACTVRMRLPAPTFVPGRCRINAFLGVPNLQHVDEIPDCLTFDVLAPQAPWRPYELYQSRGLVCRTADWTYVDAVT